MFEINKGCLYYTNNDLSNIVNKWIAVYNDNELNNIMINQKNRDNNKYHITVFSSNDKYNVNIDELNKLKISIYDIGIGCHIDGNNIVYFIIVYSDELRKINSNKDFHITIGYKFNDIHNVDKSINKLIIEKSTEYNNLLHQKIHNIIESKIHDNIVYNLLNKNYFKTYSDLHEICKNYSKNLNIINIASLKLIDLNYSCGVLFQYKIEKYKNGSSDILINYLNHEFNDENNIYMNMIINELNKIEFNKIIDSYYIISNNIIKKIDLPRNFTYVYNNLYASSIPSKKEYFDIFHKLDIKNIITLMENPLQINDDRFTFYHINVDDKTPPTINQMDKIIDIIENDRCLVHCLGGIGRTATVLICYLIYKLKITKTDSLNMINNRKTILTESQLNFINNWWKKCNEIEKIKLPNYVLFVGYPSSGKSTLSKHIETHYNNVIRLNQDENRDKKGLLDSLILNLKKNKIVILDRCNLTKEERKYWLSYKNNNKTWCIFMNTSFDECCYRISNRDNHETIKKEDGINILNNLKDILEPPTLSEDFDKIIQINDDNDVIKLLNSLDIPLIEITNKEHIYKFPRTRHLLNLGAASRDDLILSKNESLNYLNKHIYIEEKIDGANLGISIKDNKIILQNRSHYINSETHSQFKNIDKWINKNIGDLWDIIIPDRYILFGEWLNVKHSIHYTNLSDVFIAFDMYDIVENKFWSRKKLENKLKNTNIKIIPLIAEGKFTSINDIGNLVNNKSNYYDGKVEGVYIRICDDNWLIDRSKIVRNDFLSSDKHWSKSVPIYNIIT